MVLILLGPLICARVVLSTCQSTVAPVGIPLMVNAPVVALHKLNELLVMLKVGAGREILIWAGIYPFAKLMPQLFEGLT